MSDIKNFTDLITWKKAHVLVLCIYNITKLFPSDEKFALTTQLRRAAVSITSNIAEGFGRISLKEKIQFYSIARGSLLEVQNQMFIAKDLGYIKMDKFEEVNKMVIEVAKMISGLKNSIK